MKVIHLGIIIFGFFLWACNKDHHKDRSLFMDHLKAGDHVLEIKEACVVFIYPDSIAVQAGMEKLKKQNEEETIAEAGADEEHYRALAKEFLQKKGLKIIETDKKSIVFVNQKGEKTKVENTLEGIATMIYFFDNQKQPRKVENITTISDGKEFDAYFKNVQ